MPNSKMKVALSVILLVVIIVAILMMTKKAEAPAPVAVPTVLVTGNVQDLISVSIVAGQAISGVQTITGSLKGGYFFEANARGQLQSNDGTVLKSFPITAISNWMTADEVLFTTTVDTTDVPKGPAHIRLMNDNPSGDSVNDKYIDIPVIVQ